jgi:hypothetical protein
LDCHLILEEITTTRTTRTTTTKWGKNGREMLRRQNWGFIESCWWYCRHNGLNVTLWGYEREYKEIVDNHKGYGGKK